MDDPSTDLNLHTHLLSGPGALQLSQQLAACLFGRIPQLLDVPADYKARVERARRRSIHYERQNRASLQADGYTWPDDAEYVGSGSGLRRGPYWEVAAATV